MGKGDKQRPVNRAAWDGAAYWRELARRKRLPGSSVVERGTVNPDVAGSSPAPAANGDEGRKR